MVFYFASASQNKRTRVIVYGVDANTLAFAQMLASDTAAPYKPVVLLDDSDGLRVGMRLGSIPVEKLPTTLEEVIDLCEDHRVTHVLFRQETLRQIPTEMMDLMLSAQLKLLVMGEAANLDDHNKKARLSVNEIKIDDLLNREVIKTDNPVVAEKHTGRVVLVTGAAGSIGSEVVMQVAKFNPSQLVLFDQAESPLYEIELKMKELFPNLNIVIFIGDVRNATRMEYLFKTYQPEVVYHAAAYKHVPMMERYPSEAILANVMGTRTPPTWR
jgi:Predicted nucleoside-diphosphate sugar epimerases